jgi:hypothetical protein
VSSSNGSRPHRLHAKKPAPRWLRLLIGALAAVVIAGALVTPVVLHSGPQAGKACTPTLLYRGREYVARRVTPEIVEPQAIGVGVVRGCGTSPANVDLRSVEGVRPTVAVGVTADSSSVYVRHGVCPASPARGLAACLRRS